MSKNIEPQDKDLLTVVQQQKTDIEILKVNQIHLENEIEQLRNAQRNNTFWLITLLITIIGGLITLFVN